jgi:DNA-binding response OmpR family regulator
VLLDPTPPELEALSVCGRMRAANQWAVIFVLGGDSREGEIRSLEASTDDYVMEPFSAEALCGWIHGRFAMAKTCGRPRRP